MQLALIQNGFVKSIQTANTDADVYALSQGFDLAIDITNSSPTPVVGWVLSGNKLVPPPGQSVVLTIQQTILEPAMAFGAQLTKQFASENIAQGITQAGKTDLIRVQTMALASCLGTGSLYDALTQISILNAAMDVSWSPFITASRLLTYYNYILVYLGKPTVSVVP